MCSNNLATMNEYYKILTINLWLNMRRNTLEDFQNSPQIADKQFCSKSFVKKRAQPIIFIILHLYNYWQLYLWLNNDWMTMVARIKSTRQYISMVLLLHEIDTDVLLTFQLLKTKMVDVSLVSEKCSIFLERQVEKCVSF